MQSDFLEGMVRDTAREQRLADAERVVLRLIAEATDRGEISPCAAESLRMYLDGMSRIVKSWRPA